MSKEISPKGAQYRYPKLSSVGRFFRVLRDVTFKKTKKSFLRGAKKTREKKKREYWEKKKKTKKKEERKSRVLYVCVCGRGSIKSARRKTARLLSTRR